MSFEVAPTAYDQFMGRFASPLAAQFADHIGVYAGQTALDVGCGPGAFTEVLAARLEPSAVAAVDPSQSFVAAIRERQPEVDVRAGSAEALPFPDSTFDVAAAQLVVHFMSDPVAGKLTVTLQMKTFSAWWEPFTFGVGPAGQYVESLDPARRNALRDRCAELLPEAPFAVEASAWTAAGRA